MILEALITAHIATAAATVVTIVEINNLKTVQNELVVNQGNLTANQLEITKKIMKVQK